MFVRKVPEQDLQNYYAIHFELGLILVLIVFILAARVQFRPNSDFEIIQLEQEEVEMEEIVTTRQIETPPPPPRPPVPVPVPDHTIIEDVEIFLDAEFDLGSPLQMPPRPVQEEEAEPEEGFFIVVEQMPELIGGLSALQQQIRYPDMARRAGIQGLVVVQFIVNEHGEIENPRILRGIGGGCDEEALRVVRNARFNPGLQRGRPVRVQYQLPVFFRLQT
jgi:periplasmic protein TonB